MKRRTNLFYNTTQDTNFITFSNYTENLTGTFLATDTKLFPSKFICLSLPMLVDNDERMNFIHQYMCFGYENKLAFLRDLYMKNTVYKAITTNHEAKLLHLQYLLEYIYVYLRDYEDKQILEDENYVRKYNTIEDINISFVGDITEQSFNGIYSDTICIINPNNISRGKIILKDEQNYSQSAEYNENGMYSVTGSLPDGYEEYEEEDTLVDYYSTSYLYGWYEPLENDVTTYKYFAPTNLHKYNINFGLTDDGITHVYDPNDPDRNTPKYDNLNTSISKISLTSKERSSEVDTIKFNVIIPLFDIVDINYESNSTEIEENQEYIVFNDIDSIDVDNYIKNIPLGMWFAPKEIVLERDLDTNYMPSWSLVLSSQFKPLPYTSEYISKYSDEYLAVSENGNSDAFVTFSQVLIRQNRILDKVEEYSKQINNIQRQLTEFGTKLNTVGTTYNLDNFNIEMLEFKEEMKSKYNEIVDTVYTYTNNLTWKFKLQE